MISVPGRKWLFAVWLGMGVSGAAHAQPNWITDMDAAVSDQSRAPVSLQFRREVQLPSKPRSFIVHVSADNRFVLIVNGRQMGAGPARGDLQHWRYESIDLAPALRRGRNVIAAQVWNDGRSAALAQVSSGRTGFWLRAEDTQQADLIESGPAWRVRMDRSRTVEPGRQQMGRAVGEGFYAAGPPETIDAALLSKDWNARESTADDWHSAVLMGSDDALPWRLAADALPQMSLNRVPSGKVVRASGVKAHNFPRSPLTVPAGTEATILIDAGRVLAAFPALVTSGGAGAEISVTYVEALYEPPVVGSDGKRAALRRLSDRAQVGDGVALGLTDNFKLKGNRRQRFEPFWWRTWRFAEIKVKTASQPVTINAFETWETGYPFLQRGRFVSDDPELNEIWRIGWKTALLDAHETYMDTAYWEQLQYIGDTRIQMLISYDVAGDARLAVQALDAFDYSRSVAGLPQSAYPGVLNQVIPPFALLWIGSLHDYWMRQPDTAVLTRTLPATRAVLDEFVRYVQPDGLVGPMPGWPFVDWRPGLDGWAERGKGMLSCIITMQFYGALREGADLENALGEPPRAASYGALAQTVRDGLNSQCWDPLRGLYADTPAKTQFSQHGAALAVLYDIAPKERHKEILEKVLQQQGGGLKAPDDITTTSYYFAFYTARALEHAGLTDRYFEFLQPWREMLHRNFTTWPETPDPSRSDTHAWSGHPTTGLTEYVAGIKPAAPGFARVRIEPHLGKLKSLDVAVAHPAGLIETRYSLRNGELIAHINLPAGLLGEFVWQGQVTPLAAGKNAIRIPSAPNEHRQ